MPYTTNVTGKPLNPMTEAFLKANWPQKMAELDRIARFQLQRKNLKPANVVKWHRLGAIARLVQN